MNLEGMEGESDRVISLESNQINKSEQSNPSRRRLYWSWGFCYFQTFPKFRPWYYSTHTHEYGVDRLRNWKLGIPGSWRSSNLNPIPSNVSYNFLVFSSCPPSITSRSCLSFLGVLEGLQMEVEEISPFSFLPTEIICYTFTFLCPSRFTDPLAWPSRFPRGYKDRGTCL